MPDPIILGVFTQECITLLLCPSLGRKQLSLSIKISTSCLNNLRYTFLGDFPKLLKLKLMNTIATSHVLPRSPGWAWLRPRSWPGRWCPARTWRRYPEPPRPRPHPCSGWTPGSGTQTCKRCLTSGDYNIHSRFCQYSVKIKNLKTSHQWSFLRTSFHAILWTRHFLQW